MQTEPKQQAEQLEALDFLTSQQRTDAIAEILATIALRTIKAEHEQEQNDHLNQ